MRYKTLSILFITYALASLATGCVSSGEYYKSRITSKSYKEMESILSGKMHIDIVPENRYTLTENLSVMYIPVHKGEGSGFNSSFYQAFMQDRVKTSDEQPRHFVVTMNLYPFSGNFSVDVASLKIVRNDGAVVAPNKWYISDHWVGNMNREKKFIYGKDRLLCYKPLNSKLTDASDQTVKVSQKTPACITLSYPIPPILPSSRFEFIIGGSKIGNKKIPPITLIFEEERNRYSSGHMIGP